MMRKYKYMAILFILLNTLKAWIVENLVAGNGAEAWFYPVPLSRFVLYFLLAIVIYLLLVRLKIRAIFILFYIIHGAYVFTHLSYYLYFKEIFHAPQFAMQFYEGFQLVRHYAIPKDPRYFIILIDLPLFILMVLNFSKLYEFAQTLHNRLNLRRVLFFICLIILTPFCFKITPIQAYIGKYSEDNVSNREKEIIRRYGLIGNDILNTYMLRYRTSLIKNLKYGRKVSFENKEMGEFNNIICIQVETLDADAVHYKYKGEYIAPFLSELSLNCIYYPYMLRALANGSTDIEFVIINSLMAIKGLPFFRLTEYDYPNSIIKKFSKSGYEALAFHNNSARFFNRNETFAKMGFQDFYDMDKMKLKAWGWGARDEDLFNFVMDKLKGQKRPFIYYIITMSSHEPFTNARLYYSNERYNDIDNKLTRDYFNSISYVDGQLKRLVDFIKDNIPGTYIFIYGDHECYANKAIFNKANGNRRQARRKAVPLFIITPGNERYAEKDKVVSMLDMGVTILNASKISFEIYTYGLNLLDIPIKEEALYFTSSSRTGNRKELFRMFSE